MQICCNLVTYGLTEHGYTAATRVVVYTYAVHEVYSKAHCHLQDVRARLAIQVNTAYCAAAS